MNLEELNSLNPADAEKELLSCCGSRRWARRMLESRPFASRESVFEAAREIWYELAPEDWLEAFADHPMIGDLESLRAKFAGTRQWAEGEQAGVRQACQEVLAGLAEGNRAYRAKFGYIFIVCATGKSAEEMLSILNERLKQEPEAEMRTAMGEQSKITRIRLEKLLS